MLLQSVAIAATGTVPNQQRRGTAAALTSANITPLAGEIVCETDTTLCKKGDGTTTWNSLPYLGDGYFADIGGNPEFTTVDIGNSDTTISRSSPGVLAVEGVDLITVGQVSELSSGASAPSTTPNNVGDIYIETTTPTLYFADATASSADWNAVGGGGGNGAPTDATYLTTTANGTLTNEVVVGPNVPTFLQTPSSANLVAALTDETGSGSAVFATSPTLVTPTLGVASSTSVVGSVTLAGNPMLGANTCTPAANGLLCEGTTADNFEGLLSFPVTASDKTITFQDATGTVYQTGGTDVAVADGGTGGSTAATARTNLGLAIGTNIQAYDADLTTYANIAPSANVQSLLGAADYNAIRGLLDLEAGTDFYSVTAVDGIAADILNGTSTFTDFNGAVIDSDNLAATVITGLPAVTTFENGDTFMCNEAGVGLRECDYDDLPGATGVAPVDATYLTTSANGTLTNEVVVDADIGTLTIGPSATVTGSNTGDQTITLTGDVTGSGTGSFAVALAADSVGDTEVAFSQWEPFTVLTPTSGDDPLIFQAPVAVTITSFNCVTIGGGDIDVDLQECDANGTNCVSGGITLADVTNTTQTDTSFADAAIDADDWMKLVLTNDAGTVDQLACRVEFTR